MFTGIIENMGTVIGIEQEQTNKHFTIASPLSQYLKVDQSISHDGVCLTVISQDADKHKVTAINETLKKSTLSNWSVGKKINLERCTIVGDRLDGHIVQGHVDTIAKVLSISNQKGSYIYEIGFGQKDVPPSATPSIVAPLIVAPLIVEKGSIALNGISLTCFEVTSSSCCVAIIPYTYENTNFHALSVGDSINIEFDMIGKYVARLLEQKTTTA